MSMDLENGARSVTKSATYCFAAFIFVQLYTHTRKKTRRNACWAAQQVLLPTCPPFQQLLTETQESMQQTGARGIPNPQSILGALLERRWVAQWVAFRCGGASTTTTTTPATLFWGRSSGGAFTQTHHTSTLPSRCLFVLYDTECKPINLHGNSRHVQQARTRVSRARRWENVGWRTPEKSSEWSGHQHVFCFIFYCASNWSYTSTIANQPNPSTIFLCLFVFLIIKKKTFLRQITSLFFSFHFK